MLSGNYCINSSQMSECEKMSEAMQSSNYCDCSLSKNTWPVFPVRECYNVSKRRVCNVFVIMA